MKLLALSAVLATASAQHDRRQDRHVPKASYPDSCVHCVTHSCPTGQHEVLKTDKTATDTMPAGCPTCRCAAGRPGAKPQSHHHQTDTCSNAQVSAARSCAAHCGQCKRAVVDKLVGVCHVRGSTAAAYLKSKCGDSSQTSQQTNNRRNNRRNNFCGRSPMQLCRQQCDAFNCPNGQCAMRQGNCCDFKCLHTSEAKEKPNHGYPKECVHCVTHSCPSGQEEVLKTAATASKIMPVGCPTCRCKKSGGH